MAKRRIIVTNIIDNHFDIHNLLHFLSGQLSDGYWENDNGYYEEFWNWLNFDVVSNHLVVKVSSKPTWDNVKDIFSNKTDDEVVRYVGKVLENCYDDATSLFERFGYGEEILDVVNNLKNYTSSSVIDKSTRKAKWIYFRDSKGIKRCKCSVCKVSYGCLDTPYCPNCGRKMNTK